MKDKECKTYIHTYKCNCEDCNGYPNRLSNELENAIEVLVKNNFSPEIYENEWNVLKELRNQK